MAKTETKAPVTFTPKALAEELGVDAKRIRSYLRNEFSRDAEAKNTTWILDAKAAEAVRTKFTPSEDTESDES